MSAIREGLAAVEQTVAEQRTPERASQGGALSGLGPVVTLCARRLHIQAPAWVLSLWALVSTILSYVSAYPSLESRAELISTMRESPGTQLLFGLMPLPGTIGQLLQWEIGAYLLLCTGLMAVLMTTRLLRGDEDDGLVELQRGFGAGRTVPFVAPLLVVGGVVGVLALGVGGLLTALMAAVDELTLRGAWALAGVTAVTGWALMAVAAIAAQAARSLGGARRLGLSALGLVFALRVAADEAEMNWLRWLSPLAWRDLVEPYSRDRFWLLLPCLTEVAAFLAVAAWLHRHREFLDGYLPDRSVSARHWAVRGHLDLLARLSWPSLLAWSVATAATAALFGAMSGSMTDLLKEGSAMAEMTSKMLAGSPVEQFMGLLTVFTVMLAVIGAVTRANALAGSEHAGLVELETAAGVPRTRLFLSQAVAALTDGVVLLLVAGGCLAALTSTQLTQDHAVARAFVFTVTQLPGLVAAVGLALALVGLAPRRTSLVWAVVAWSAFAQCLGGLVKLPKWAQDLSVIGHYVDVIGAPDWKPLAVQLAVGLAGAAVGLCAYRRRDLGA